MSLRKRVPFLLAVLLPVGASSADGYPTLPDEKDKLCEVIGEAPNLSVPPRDRLWFKENCVCIAAGCGAPGSPRFTTRKEAGRRDAQRRAEAERAAEAARKEDAKRRAAMFVPNRRATAKLRQAYWACDADSNQKSCTEPAEALEAACRARGLHVSPTGMGDDDCYRKDE